MKSICTESAVWTPGHVCECDNVGVGGWGLGVGGWGLGFGVWELGDLRTWLDVPNENKCSDK